MATHFIDLLPAITALADSSKPIDLDRVAALVGLSASRVQRVFSAEVGESPDSFGRSIALDAAAIALMACDDRVIDIAFQAGFDTHEGFSRAFRTRFGESPSQWRRLRRHALAPGDVEHVVAANRCLRLHHRPLQRREPAMTYTIETETLIPTPILYRRSRVAHDEMGAALGELLPAVFGYVMEVGLAPAGHPFVRYVGDSPAFATIEAGIPLVNAATEEPPADTGIVSGELPGGLAAVTTHRGPYEELGAAHAALDRWIDESEHDANGDRWELFLTDPGDVPDPADWLTKVCWPIR